MIEYPPASCVHCIHQGTGTPGNGTEDSATGWSVCPEHLNTPVTDQVKNTVMTSASASYRMNITDLPPADGVNSYGIHLETSG